MIDCRRTWLPLLIALTVCGCGGRRNVDVLEGRLRHQEALLADLESKLESNEAELHVSQKTVETLRSQLAGRGEETILPEQASVLYGATGIRFNQLLTGGHDIDGQPGDELLNAVLIPHDVDGELVKLPGTIQLDVSDLTKPRGQQLIGSWEFSTKESRAFWHRGFISSGYIFRLPWQQVPETPELLLHARLITPDGRQFDKSQIIHITPPSMQSRDEGLEAVSEFEREPNTNPFLRQLESDAQPFPFDDRFQNAQNEPGRQ